MTDPPDAYPEPPERVMPDDTPTARGQDYFNLRNRIAGALDVILGDEPHPREQECIDAILAALGDLSLVQLAATLQAAGLTVLEGLLNGSEDDYWDVYPRPMHGIRTSTACLVISLPVVGVKEKTDG